MIIYKLVLFFLFIFHKNYFINSNLKETILDFKSYNKNNVRNQNKKKIKKRKYKFFKNFFIFLKFTLIIKAIKKIFSPKIISKFIDTKEIEETKDLLINNYSNNIHISNIFKENDFKNNNIDAFFPIEKLYTALIHEFSHAIIDILTENILNLKNNITIQINFYNVLNKFFIFYGGSCKSNIHSNLINSISSISGIIGQSLVYGTNSIYEYSQKKLSDGNDFVSFHKFINNLCNEYNIEKNKIYKLKDIIIRNVYDFFSKNIYKIMEIVDKEFMRSIDLKNKIKITFFDSKNSILKNKSFSLIKNNNGLNLIFNFSTNPSHKIFNEMKKDYINMISNIKNEINILKNIKIK